MHNIEDTFKALGIKKIDEKSVEMKEVTVKLNFTFEDGEIADEFQRAIYNMLVQKDAIIEESSDIDEFQE